MCHCSADKPQVRALRARLAQIAGVAPWLDEVELLPGHDWAVEISKAIRESHIVLVCLSEAATTKEGFVQKEIRAALDVADEKPEGMIFVVPVRLEDCGVPQRLQRWQWVDLFQEAGFEVLCRSLTSRAAALGIEIETSREKQLGSLRDREAHLRSEIGFALQNRSIIQRDQDGECEFHQDQIDLLDDEIRKSESELSDVRERLRILDPLSDPSTSWTAASVGGPDQSELDDEDSIRKSDPSDISFMGLELKLSDTWDSFRAWLEQRTQYMEILSIREDENRERTFHSSGRPGSMSYPIEVRCKKGDLPASFRLDLVAEWLHPQVMALRDPNSGIP